MLQDERIVQMRSDKVERRGLMAALDASQALIWFDNDGKVVDANKNTLRMFGFREDEMLGKSYADLIHARDFTEPLLMRHWDRIRSGSLRNEERSFFSSAGSEIWTSTSYAAIKTEYGVTRRVLALLIDLSPWSWKPNDSSHLAGAI